MVAIDVTKVSSKGQVVIPRKFRDKFKEGDNIIVIESGNNLIIKRESEADKQFQEDLVSTERIIRIWNQYKKRAYKDIDFQEFYDKTKNNQNPK